MIKVIIAEDDPRIALLHQSMVEKLEGFEVIAIANTIAEIQEYLPLMKPDLLLLDVGAEYANYASDMTRTIPVSGKFSKRQREVYNAVKRVKDDATKMLVPGNYWKEYHE